MVLYDEKTFRNAAMVAVTTSPASACAGGGWRILHLEWFCCWIWGNNHKGCKQPEFVLSQQLTASATSCSSARARVPIMDVPAHREIACAILIDLHGRFLLQRRDDVPNIL